MSLLCVWRRTAEAFFLLSIFVTLHERINGEESDSDGEERVGSRSSVRCQGAASSRKADFLCNLCRDFFFKKAM